MVSLPKKKEYTVLAYSFVAVYCMNFIFLCVTIKLFSLSFEPLLATKSRRHYWLSSVQVLGSSGTQSGSPRPRSAELKPVGRPRCAESNKTESDDLALVECSGRFQMMSITELTALQRRSAPDSGRWASRSPAPAWTFSPRSAVLM